MMNPATILPIYKTMIFNENFPQQFMIGVMLTSYYAFTLVIVGFGFYLVEIKLLLSLKRKIQNKGNLRFQKIIAKTLYYSERAVGWFAPRQYHEAFPPGFYKISRFKVLCFLILITYLYPGWHRRLFHEILTLLSDEKLYDFISQIYSLLNDNLKTIGLIFGLLTSLSFIVFKSLNKIKLIQSAKQETKKNGYEKAFVAHRKFNKYLIELNRNFERNIEIFYRQTKDVGFFVELLRSRPPRFILPFEQPPVERLSGEYRSSAKEIECLLEIQRQMEDDCFEDEFFELAKNFRWEFFRLGFQYAENSERLAATFLDRTYMEEMLKSWKENIIENCFDEESAERDIKWRVEHILAEALEEKILLEKLIERQHRNACKPNLLMRLAAALPS